MGFVPIAIEDYIKLHLKSNRGAEYREVRKQLQQTLKAYRRGVRCSCGNPICVIGASQVGYMCFTCATGEAYPDGDYEIDEACGKEHAPGPRSTAVRAVGVEYPRRA